MHSCMGSLSLVCMALLTGKGTCAVSASPTHYPQSILDLSILPEFLCQSLLATNSPQGYTPTLDETEKDLLFLGTSGQALSTTQIT